MEKRILVKDLEAGMTLVRCGSRTFNSRITEIADVPAGFPVKGPRGGRYALTAAGAAQLLSVRLVSGRPMLSKTATAVILVQA